MYKAAVTVDDGVMTGWKRVSVWASAIVAGLALVGLGVYFVLTGLDRADKVASVIGLFVGLIGLGVSAYGTVLSRRGLEQPAGQTMAGSTASEVVQVRDVQGSLNIGRAAAGGLPAPPGSLPPAAPSVTTRGGQSVIGSQVSGPVRQVHGISGDAEIDK